MDDSAFFFARGLSNGPDRNEIPEPRQRLGNPFWEWTGRMLGLPGERFEPVNNDGVSPAIQTIRAYEERRLGPTLGELAHEVAVHAVEAAKEVAGKVVKVTKISQAKAWLADMLQHGPVAMTVIQEAGLKAGFNLKMLKDAKKRLRIVSARKGRNHFVWQLPAAKAPDAGEP